MKYEYETILANKYLRDASDTVLDFGRANSALRELALARLDIYRVGLVDAFSLPLFVLQKSCQNKRRIYPLTLSK